MTDATVAIAPDPLSLPSLRKAIFSGPRLRDLPNLLRLYKNAASNEAVLQRLRAKDGTLDATALDTEVPVLGVLVWPFMNRHWDAERRLEAIEAHLDVLAGLSPAYRITDREKLQIADLSVHFDGLRVILDRPRWFVREGLMTINAFVGDRRAYSLVFSFGEIDDSLVMVIGAIQGRSFDGANDLYRDMTKTLHGLRPRDMIIELARLVAQSVGARSLLGVADDARVHRHAYFGGKALEDTSDYDQIWADRGGERRGDYYWMDVAEPRRPISDVKSKKRSLYRKRYAMLDEVEQEVRDGLASPELVAFEDT